MQELYHYTNADGLLGILKKGIWLTNIQFLNDSSEFEEGKKIIYQEIENRIKEIKENPIPTPEGFHFGEINQDAIVNYLNFLKMPLANSSHPSFDTRNYLFIFSLSTKRDLLSQWRTYSQNGGYSIKFDPLVIDNFVKEHNHNNNFAIEKCIYKEEDKINEAKKAIDMGIQAFLKMATAVGSMEEMQENDKAAHIDQYYNLIMLAGRFKDYSFHEESEVRIISNGYRDEWLSHRVSGNIIIPYLEIPIGNEAIQEIMASPINESTKSMASVSSLLNQLKLFGKIKMFESSSTLIK